jgi:hypothetical protein
VREETEGAAGALKESWKCRLHENGEVGGRKSSGEDVV